MDYYTGSKGDKTLISEMQNPHLVHSIAKLAAAIEGGTTQVHSKKRPCFLRL